MRWQVKAKHTNALLEGNGNVTMRLTDAAPNEAPLIQLIQRLERACAMGVPIPEEEIRSFLETAGLPDRVRSVLSEYLGRLEEMDTPRNDGSPQGE
jgi:hypothetical protein